MLLAAARCCSLVLAAACFCLLQRHKHTLKLLLQAGRRTDFRVNCLHDSAQLGRPSERGVCIIPAGWWKQKSGHEAWSNRRRACCEPELRSNYSLAHLEALATSGRGEFRWFRPPKPSGVRAIDEMLLGSGGTALHTAVSLCNEVRVYGAGLLSESP